MRAFALSQAALLAMALLLSLAVHQAWAQTQVPDVPLADPALEERARHLMKEVRCVVCQAQSIDESDAGIASDMRRLIREEIAGGKSDDEILTYLSDRYGDFVLFSPPFKARTLLLWVGPFLLLGFGGAIMILFFKRRIGAEAATGAARLSDEEQRRVEAALKAGLAESDGDRTGSGSAR
ncbi:cytochrome c-type biogenesis protein [Dongia sp.]|uniref:cytochrome c-type biogenesis protein n=1 Tax=Dongia sp. TaxID=1977262 RepID=UPI0035B4F704